jgi:hypothetical protein
VKHFDIITSVLLFLLNIYCDNDNPYPYSIRDFRKELQPHLEKIVSKGVVGYYELDSTLTDGELLQMSRSEHPVLRSTALQQMLYRKTFDHFDIVMNHLDDTAIVPTDEGEWGVSFTSVSDNVLYHARWKTEESLNQTVEVVLTKHNYLSLAYVKLLNLPPQEKFYSYIRDMATRTQRPFDKYKFEFDDAEKALYGLARFKKKEDISIIKNRMLEYDWRLSDVSFSIIREFPDTAWFEVLRRYHRYQFYQFSGNRAGGFSGSVADRAAPEDFINALVVQKTPQAARLLDTAFMRLTSGYKMRDAENITNHLVMAIWENPCLAYETVRKKIKPRAEKILKRRKELDTDSAFPLKMDTSEFKIRKDTTLYFWR